MGNISSTICIRIKQVLLLSCHGMFELHIRLRFLQELGISQDDVLSCRERIYRSGRALCVESQALQFATARLMTDWYTESRY